MSGTFGLDVGVPGRRGDAGIRCGGCRPLPSGIGRSVHPFKSGQHQASCEGRGLHRIQVAVWCERPSAAGETVTDPLSGPGVGGLGMQEGLATGVGEETFQTAALAGAR